MNRRDRTSPSNTRISWLLRHGAREARLSMDEAGWAPIGEVLRALRIDREALDGIVSQNNKARFDVEGDRIRASQGHSLDGMPVTREALEASWAIYKGEDRIWHGTHVEAIEGIAREGIHSGQRTHVHLARGLDSTVGKRHNVHVMLAVSVERLRKAGLEVYESPNGVILTRSVPADCIVHLRAISQRAQAQQRALQATLNL